MDLSKCTSFSSSELTESIKFLSEPNYKLIASKEEREEESDYGLKIANLNKITDSGFFIEVKNTLEFPYHFTYTQEFSDKRRKDSSLSNFTKSKKVILESF